MNQLIEQAPPYAPGGLETTVYSPQSGQAPNFNGVYQNGGAGFEIWLANKWQTPTVNVTGLDLGTVDSSGINIGYQFNQSQGSGSFTAVNPSAVYISNQTTAPASWDDPTQWIGAGFYVTQAPSSNNQVFVLPNQISGQVVLGSNESAASVTVETGTLPGTGELVASSGSSLQTGSLSVIGGGLVTLNGGAITVSGNTTLGGAFVDPTGSWGGAGGSSDGQIAISQGGTLTTQNLDIGAATNSTGTVTVSDQGSALTVNGKLTIADSGNGVLTVQNNGSVQSGASVIGVVAGAVGTVTVTGTSSRWQAQSLVLGQQGGGTITVSQGGSLAVSGNATIAQQGYGTLTVTDAPSQVTVGGDLTVGNSGGNGNGNGTVNVQNGATLGVTGNLTLASSAGDQGAMTVTGSNSSVLVGLATTIGSSGKGQLTVQNGALFQGDSFSIASSAGSTGTVTVQNDASSLEVGSLTVGGGGNGTLTINDNGSVSSQGGTVGAQTGGVGTVNVGGDNGPGSWSLSGNLTIGSGGSGNVTLSDGANVNLNGNNLTIGSQAGSAGTLTLDGASATLSNVSAVKVGDSGGGSLVMVNGATLTVATLSVGASQGGSGDVYLSDAGTQLTAVGGQTTSGNVTIGSAGVGTLEITNGAGLLTNGNASVGSNIGGMGTVTMTIGGSWQVDGSLTVGGSGTGKLSVDGNSALSVKGNITLGSNSPSGNGTLNVDGRTTGTNQFSTLFYGGTLTVGSNGTGELNVLNGAVVEPIPTTGTGAVSIATNSGSQGTITVDGASSELIYGKSLAVGGAGVGTLEVTNGGVVTYGAGTNGAVAIAGSDGSSGSTATVDGAGSQLNAATLTIGSTNSTGGLNVSNGGSVTAATRVLLNAGSSINTSTGEINVGTTANGAIGNLTVGNGGTLKGGGSVIGNVVNAGGTVDLGDPNILSITGAYSQTNGELIFDVYGADPGDYDMLKASGNISITGGTIDIDFLGSTLPFAGEQLDFISAQSLNLTGVDFLVTGLGIGADYTESLNNGVLAFDVVDPGQPVSTTPVPPTFVLFGTALLGLGLLLQGRQNRRFLATATA